MKKFTGKYGKGWLKDGLDRRDHIYKAPPNLELDQFVDYRFLLDGWDAYDQLREGSCTANSFIALFRGILRKLGLPDFEASRQALYNMTRFYEGTLDSDAGASIRDTVLIALSDGLAAEKDMPYSADSLFVKPSGLVYHQALTNKAFDAQKITDDDGSTYHNRHCLSEGNPINFGINVYPSFESDQVAATGIVPVPGEGEVPDGGHALARFGYVTNAKLPFKTIKGAIIEKPDLAGGYDIVRGSWGQFGDNGWVYLPWQYSLSPQYASDNWTVKRAA